MGSGFGFGFGFGFGLGFRVRVGVRARVNRLAVDAQHEADRRRSTGLGARLG